MAELRDREMTLMEHLLELRQRLIVAAGAVLAFTVVGFILADRIIKLLVLPAKDVHLIAVSPTEAFTTYMRVGFFAGIALAMPVILYEIFRYIDPALHPHERRFVLAMGLPVIALFVTGMAFCYFVLLPNALPFLLNFGSDVIEATPRASDYVSFVTTFLLGIGLVFEMPAVIFALVKVHVVQRKWLARQRRYMFLIAFVIAAIITPTPDPFNQTLVGLPLYGLFEVGLFVSRWA